MNHIEFNNKAVQLIQSLQSSLQQLDSCGDVGGAVEDEVVLLKTFMAENKVPQVSNDSMVNKMLEERDQYACIAVSTAALTHDDERLLDWLIGEHDNMVFSRDTGYLVKLYEEPEANLLCKVDKNNYNIDKVLLAALSAGYRMVEFDRDAELYKDGLYTISM